MQGPPGLREGFFIVRNPDQLELPAESKAVDHWVDLNTQELFLNIEAERRFGDNLSVELQLRSFMNAEPGDALFTVEQDDYLQLRLNWYY